MTMTSKERVLATLKGQPCDRQPVTPIFMAWAAHFIGRSYRDFYLDGEVLVEAQLADIRGRDLTARIADDPLLPVDFVLHQNYPNPFNAETQIIYELPHAARVTIEVINTMGQHVTTLLDREETAGVHRATWNGADSDGNPVASGIYLYQFKSGDFIETKKRTLLK